MTAILSIQSSVAYGHVGNSAAVFPLQRLGIDVWPVLTVHFSNHTGYGAWRGQVFVEDLIREVVTGIEDRGVLLANVNAPDGSTLQYTARYLSEIERIGMTRPEFDRVFVVAGNPTVSQGISFHPIYCLYVNLLY